LANPACCVIIIIAGFRTSTQVTNRKSFQDHEEAHKSDTFQPPCKQVLELSENGNEEIAYNMLWSGAAYSAEEAKAQYAIA
jgi:hypothetical protein